MHDDPVAEQEPLARRQPVIGGEERARPEEPVGARPKQGREVGGVVHDRDAQCMLAEGAGVVDPVGDLFVDGIAPGAAGGVGDQPAVLLVDGIGDADAEVAVPVLPEVELSVGGLELRVDVDGVAAVHQADAHGAVFRAHPFRLAPVRALGRREEFPQRRRHVHLRNPLVARRQDDGIPFAVHPRFHLDDVPGRERPVRRERRIAVVVEVVPVEPAQPQEDRLVVVEVGRSGRGHRQAGQGVNRLDVRERLEEVTVLRIPLVVSRQQAALVENPEAMRLVDPVQGIVHVRRPPVR